MNGSSNCTVSQYAQELLKETEKDARQLAEAEEQIFLCDAKTVAEARLDNYVSKRVVVQRALNGMTIPSVNLSATGLHLSSIARLEPNQWLSDDIVNRYIKTCVSVSTKAELSVTVAGLTSFLVSSLAADPHIDNAHRFPLPDADIVLLPVFIRRSHWVLCVIRRRHKEVFWLDSLGQAASIEHSFGDPSAVGVSVGSEFTAPKELVTVFRYLSSDRDLCPEWSEWSLVTRGAVVPVARVSEDLHAFPEREDEICLSLSDSSYSGGGGRLRALRGTGPGTILSTPSRFDFKKPLKAVNLADVTVNEDDLGKLTARFMDAQSTVNDCGVFVCAAAKALTLGIPLFLVPRLVNKYRQLIAYELLHGQLIVCPTYLER